jgi:hypothetical protein
MTRIEELGYCCATLFLSVVVLYDFTYSQQVGRVYLELWGNPTSRNEYLGD